MSSTRTLSFAVVPFFALLVACSGAGPDATGVEEEGVHAGPAGSETAESVNVQPRPVPDKVDVSSAPRGTTSAAERAPGDGLPRPGLFLADKPVTDPVASNLGETVEPIDVVGDAGAAERAPNQNVPSATLLLADHLPEDNR